MARCGGGDSDRREARSSRVNSRVYLMIKFHTYWWLSAVVCFAGCGVGGEADSTTESKGGQQSSAGVVAPMAGVNTGVPVSEPMTRAGAPSGAKNQDTNAGWEANQGLQSRAFRVLAHRCRRPERRLRTNGGTPMMGGSSGGRPASGATPPGGQPVVNACDGKPDGLHL